MRGLIIDLLFSSRLLLFTLMVIVSILLCRLQIATMIVVIGIRIIVSRTMISTATITMVAVVVLVISASVMAAVICTVVTGIGIVLLIGASHELLLSSRHLAITLLLSSVRGSSLVRGFVVTSSMRIVGLTTIAAAIARIQMLLLLALPI